VVGFDEPGDRVVSPAVGIGSGSGAVDADGGDTVVKVCGDAVDVRAVDPGWVIDGAVEIGVLEEAEVENFDIGRTRMSHDPLVLDLVKVHSSLEG